MMVDQEGHSLDFFVSAIHEQNHMITVWSKKLSVTGADCKQGGKSISAGMIIKKIDYV